LFLNASAHTLELECAKFFVNQSINQRFTEKAGLRVQLYPSHELNARAKIACEEQEIPEYTWLAAVACD